MTDTTIRRLRPGEAALFRRIRMRALKESPEAFGSSYESALARRPESWAEQADASASGPDRATLLAFAGAEPVGIMALYRHAPGAESGELIQVWVAPEARGRGLARALFEALQTWAQASGFQRIRATVAGGNAAVLGFYEGLGFQVEGPAPPEEGENALWLIKTVT